MYWCDSSKGLWTQSDREEAEKTGIVKPGTENDQEDLISVYKYLKG